MYRVRDNANSWSQQSKWSKGNIIVGDPDPVWKLDPCPYLVQYSTNVLETKIKVYTFDKDKKCIIKIILGVKDKDLYQKGTDR